MKPIIIDGISYDPSTMTLDELITLKIQIDDAVDSINDQLKRAQVELKATGVYSNSDWYWSAVRAKKHKQRQSQIVQHMLGKARRDNQRRLEKYFVDVAKRMLDEETFQEILEEADYLLGNSRE